VKNHHSLRALTHAAEEIAAGNLDVKIDCNADGDVGILAQSFQHTVEHLKSYISNINALARTDGMTGMENRTAYLARIAELDPSLAKKMLSHFAVIMFDLNNLKYVNDEYGHAEGDKYIIASAKLLKKSFPDAELFRFGGDEFVALQFNTSPAELDALILGFEENVEKRNKRHNVKMSIACGYALYDEKKDTCLADVYNRADAAMYAQKRKLKASIKAYQQVI
jgi:diguanylate cyclase (GGDEF)-like protein